MIRALILRCEEDAASGRLRAAGLIRKEKNMTSRAFSTGAGMVIGLLLSWFIITRLNKDGKFRTEYDERQKEVRGTAYRYAFYAMMICEAVLMVASLEIDLGILGSGIHFIPIYVGVIVQVVYSIMNDGYFGLNNDTGKYMVFMAVISVFNLLSGVLSLRDCLAEGSELSVPICSLGAGTLFLAVAAAMLAKKFAGGKGGDEE